MKKISTLLFFTNILFLANAQLTYMPDDAFENYVEGGSFNNDNYVSTASIQVWPLVSIPVAVQDLTGIEDFGHIYILNILGSNLSVIDLSNCPNLLFSTINTQGGLLMWIADCPFLTKIIMPPNEIAFTIGGQVGCPYLSEIIFQNSNVIRNVDPGDPTASSNVGICPSLTCLDMSNILDVKIGSSLIILGNDTLVGLNLKNGKCNKWSSVQIIGNSSLTCIQVDNPAYCNNAQSLGAWYFDCFDDPLSQCSYSTSCPNCIAELDELPTVSINISPNPTTSKITVKSSLELIGEEYIIYDQLGKAVKSGVITDEETEIDLSNLTVGLYLFKTGAEMEETFKIIKQ